MTQAEVKALCALRRRGWSIRRIALEMGYQEHAIRYRLRADAEDAESETGPSRRSYARKTRQRCVACRRFLVEASV